MNRRGMTLIEVIVVLAVLGIVAGLVAPSLHLALPADAGHETQSAVAALRRRALESGRAADTLVEHGGRIRVLHALPDGRVLADTSFGIDPLSGRPRAPLH
jgi:prepilin-type N-terminal cleavage/methylation domain-containing protein